MYVYSLGVDETPDELFATRDASGRLDVFGKDFFDETDLIGLDFSGLSSGFFTGFVFFVFLRLFFVFRFFRRFVPLRGIIERKIWFPGGFGVGELFDCFFQLCVFVALRLVFGFESLDPTFQSIQFAKNCVPIHRERRLANRTTRMRQEMRDLRHRLRSPLFRIRAALEHPGLVLVQMCRIVCPEHGAVTENVPWSDETWKPDVAKLKLKKKGKSVDEE